MELSAPCWYTLEGKESRVLETGLFLQGSVCACIHAHLCLCVCVCVHACVYLCVFTSYIFFACFLFTTSFSTQIPLPKGLYLEFDKLLPVKTSWCCAVLSWTLCDPMDCSPPGSSVHGDSPGKNTGVGNLSLLQVIFPTQELNQGLLHCRRILYQLSHPGSPIYTLLYIK